MDKQVVAELLSWRNALHQKPGTCLGNWVAGFVGKDGVKSRPFCILGRASLKGMPDRSGNRPRDVNELAKRLVEEATGEAEPTDPPPPKNPAAVELGRRGGLKGGRVRAERMTPEERSEAARRAALSRWRAEDRTD